MYEVLEILGAMTYVCMYAFLLISFGVIPSLSDSFYYLERQKKGTGIYFTVYTALVSMFTLPPLLQFAEGWIEQTLSVLACLGLVVVGASPKFAIEKYRRWHIIGVAICAAPALAIVVLKGFWYVIPMFTILAVVATLCTKRKGDVLWAESICFNSLFYTLLIT